VPCALAARVFVPAGLSGTCRFAMMTTMRPAPLGTARTALFSRHGRLVRRRWGLRRLLNAGEGRARAEGERENECDGESESVFHFFPFSFGIPCGRVQAADYLPGGR